MNRIFSTAFALVLLASAGAPSLALSAPKARFDAAHDELTVALCSAVYERLYAQSGRLASREARTEGVVRAYRGKLRLAPFVEQAGVDPDAALPQGIGVLLFSAVGNAQAGHPEEDPHVVEARVLLDISLVCDQALDKWGALPITDSPPDVLAFGYAEHLLGGKSSSEAFPDKELANLARTACEGDSAGIARALAAGANPNGRGVDGVTPLLWALTCENLAGMEALLTAGADPNLDLKGNRSAVFFAAGYRNTELLKLLLRYHGDPSDHDEDETALMQAFDLGTFGAGWGNWDALLAAGADINQVVGEDPDNFPRTIALRAAERGRWDRVVELLERGYNRELDELGRMLESDVYGPGPEDKGKVGATVRLLLEQRGVNFPVGPKTLWVRYRALDGTMRKVASTGYSYTELGRHYFNGEKEDRFGGEQVDLWYWPEIDAFFEEVDDKESPRHGTFQIDIARLKTMWHLTDEQISSIRQAPQSWEWTKFD